MICDNFCVGMLVYMSVIPNDVKLVVSVTGISCRSVINCLELNTVRVFGNGISLLISSDTNLANRYAGATFVSDVMKRHSVANHILV
jgi:hypothetical protein